MKFNNIKTLSSKIVYENPWMVVKEDKVKRSSGAEGVYGIVEKPDFVVVIPIQNNDIYLVDQYRYPIKRRSLELPQGSLELKVDNHHLDAANRELREETGLISRKMNYVGFQHLACGYSNQAYHIYLATKLEQSTRILDVEEEDLCTKKLTLSHFKDKILSGKITDATTINAFFLAQFKGMI